MEAVNSVSIDLTVPEHKKDKQWYRTIITQYCQSYNRPFWINGMILNPISEIQLNRAYYYSAQGNIRNLWAVQDSPVQGIQSKSNEYYRLLNYLTGKASELMVKFNITSDVLSSNAVTLKEQLKNLYLFQVENQDFVESMAKLGVTMNGFPKGENFQTPEDVEYYMSMKYRDNGAIVAELLAKEIMRTSDYFTKRVTDFWNILIAGFWSSDLEIINGQLREVSVLPEEVIMDLRNPNDNCFNDAAMFRGRFINLSTPYEILERYNDYLDEEAKNEIKELAKSTVSTVGRSFMNDYPMSPTGTYDWYSISQSLGNPVTGMSVAKMYFLARCDYRTKTKKGKIVYERDYDEKGNSIPQNQNRQGIHLNWRVYQGVLIAGKWVVCEGLVNNAVYSQTISGKQLFPQTLYVHDYNSGWYKSLGSRLRDLQDDINLCDIKIKEAELNDMGVNYVFNAGRAKDASIKQIITDFKSMHLTSLKIDADDDDEYSNRLPLFEQIDYTGSLKVVEIYRLIKDDYRREMERLTYLPDVATGMQDKTIGKGVQSQSLSLSSTGLMGLFNGFVSSIQKRLQLSTNILKLMMLSPDYDESYARMIVGDNGYNWIKTAELDDLEQLGTYIDPYDVVDDIARQKLEGRIQAGMQNGLLTFADVTKIDNMTSLREISAYIHYITEKRERESKQMAEQQRQDQMAINQMNSQIALQGKQIPAQAQMEAAKQRAEATKYTADKQQETKIHDTNTNANVKLATNNGRQ